MPLEQRADDSSESIDTASRARTATYIADLVAEMERLARRERLSPLARFLGVARQEARRAAREP